MSVRMFATCLLTVGLLGCASAGATSTPETLPPVVTALPTTSTSAAPTTTVTTPKVDLMTLARSSVLRVRNVVCLATGTAFKLESGQVITNRHVAARSRRVELSTWDGTDLVGAVTAVSSDHDLASMTVESPRAGLILAERDPVAGDAITVAGYPEGNQLDLRRGAVIDLDPGHGEAGGALRATVAIKPGNSGSPVLNDQGEVVGIAYAIQRSTDDALLVPVSALKALLAGSDPTTSAPGCE